MVVPDPWVASSIHAFATSVKAMPPVARIEPSAVAAFEGVAATEVRTPPLFIRHFSVAAAASSGVVWNSILPGVSFSAVVPSTETPILAASDA